MPRTRLIVNADDGNLTSGVLRGVLRGHDQGIVTSTTIFANLSLTDELRSTLRARANLGVGLHLNITLGLPVASANEVVRLLCGKNFGKHDTEFFQTIDREQLYIEYKTQIERFADWRGELPTHLDTHHHLHRYPAVFEVLLELAEEYALPVRLSEMVTWPARERLTERGVHLADHLLSDIENSPFFSSERLNKVLNDLPAGTVEIMCHPAEIDDELRHISSLVNERAMELAAFTQTGLRKMLEGLDVELTHYGKLAKQLS